MIPSDTGALKDAVMLIEMTRNDKGEYSFWFHNYATQLRDLDCDDATILIGFQKYMRDFTDWAIATLLANCENKSVVKSHSTTEDMLDTFKSSMVKGADGSMTQYNEHGDMTYHSPSVEQGNKIMEKIMKPEEYQKWLALREKRFNNQ